MVDRGIIADVELDNGDALLAQLLRMVAVLRVWITHGCENHVAGVSHCLGGYAAKAGTGARDQYCFGHGMAPFPIRGSERSHSLDVFRQFACEEVANDYRDLWPLAFERKMTRFEQ